MLHQQVVNAHSVPREIDGLALLIKVTHVVHDVHRVLVVQIRRTSLYFVRSLVSSLWFVSFWFVSFWFGLVVFVLAFESTPVSSPMMCEIHCIAQLVAFLPIQQCEIRWILVKPN